MAVKHLGDGVHCGLSTDTKPTVPAAYRYFSTDTGDWEIFDGTYWWLLSYPGPLSSKRVGYHSYGAAVNGPIGMLASVTASTGAGTQTMEISDVSGGRFINCVTGTTSGNKGGFRAVAAGLSIRDWNPRIRFRFSQTNNTDHRFWIGFTNQSGELTGDDPLNALHGFMIGAAAADTNYRILHNDGSGATVSDDTTIARNTSIHEVRLVADNANTRFSWSIDGGAYTHVSTEIPAAATNCTVHYVNETATTAAKIMRVYNIFVQSDK